MQPLKITNKQRKQNAKQSHDKLNNPRESYPEFIVNSKDFQNPIESQYFYASSKQSIFYK